MESKTQQTPILNMLKNKIELIESEEMYLYLVGPIKLPVNLGGETVEFSWYSWLKVDEPFKDTEELVQQLKHMDLASSQQSSVLVHGDFHAADDAYIRLHSICHTGDIFGSKRCDCGFQLKSSMKMIVEKGHGALFYLANHEGRGIGLFSKALAYALQEEGLDTVEANEALGFVDDGRQYDEALHILQALRVKPVTLITNNPKKLAALQAFGLPLSGREPLWGDVSLYNEFYLETKVKRSGHLEEEGVLS